MKRKVAKVGLEPAYFSQIAPQLEIVSLGAEIENAHSVKESVSVDSIGKLFNLISETLEELV